MKSLSISLIAISVALSGTAFAFGPKQSGETQPVVQLAQAQSQGAFFGQGRGREGHRGSGEPVFMAGWDANEDGILSLEEASERRGELFDALDDNSDGVVDSAEFKAFLDDMTPDEDEASNNRRALGGMTLGFNDANNDGSVTRQEFIARTAAFLEGMDRDGDGIVSNKDFGPRSAQMNNGGQGRGQGMGNGRGQGRGMGHGQGMGRGKGQGQGEGRGNGQGRRWQQQG